MTFRYWLALGLLNLPLLSGAELSIPEERAFDVRPSFPATTLPAGRLSRTVAPEWRMRSLNGMWKFQEVPFVRGEELLTDDGMKQGLWKPEVSCEHWQSLSVPFGWYEIPRRDYACKGKIGYFRRRFEVSPDDVRGHRLILDFRRVSYRGDVWVNGRRAGAPHYGRASGFQYDITALVRPGSNDVSVRVYDFLGHSSYKMRPQNGGINDSVRLLHIPARFYVPRAMITPHLEDGSIGVQLETLSAEALKGLRCDVINYKDGRKVAEKDFSSFNVPQGQQWSELGRITLRKPRLWSPEDPHLYVLRVLDQDGCVAGYERFGFREFRTSGEWLLLNGKKFKPRMFTFSVLFNRALFTNENHDTEKMLRLYKEQLHVNMIRPHANQTTLLETVYDICDEIGMMVYFDWSGLAYSWDADEKVSSQEAFRRTKPDLENFLRENHNRPSIVMWSFGNELYEGDYAHSAALTEAYHWFRKLDRQRRPICGSTGRYNLSALQGRLVKEPTDILDDHQYRGSYCGSWQENIGHIEEYARTARQAYAEPKPKIDAEYGVPGDCARYRQHCVEQLMLPLFKLDRNSRKFKEGYAKLWRQPEQPGGGWLRLRSNYATADDYLDKKSNYQKHAQRYLKRFVEIYRRAGVKCLGGHTNLQWYDMIRDFPDGYLVGDCPLTGSETWFLMPQYYTMARVYNPLLVSAGVFNEQPYADREETVDVFVTNDLNAPGSFRVVPQLRLQGRKVITMPAIEFGQIPGMEQRSRQLVYRLPSLDRVAHGRLELYLFKDGKPVGNNFYELAVFPQRQVTLPPRCAVYDSAGVKFRGLIEHSTMKVLKDYGTYTLISDFDQLDRFTHLILGSNSFDRVVIEGSDKIFQWVTRGGKLLALEQSFCGKVPFLSSYDVVSGNPGTHVIQITPGHPVFKNLRQADMDSWFGNLGRMSRFCLAPLDAGMVAVTPTAAWRDTDSVKSVLCDVKVGKGEMILSQLAATDKLARSGAAGEYVASLLEYFGTPGVSAYAFPVSNAQSSRVLYVDDSKVFHVDLSQVVNRSFSDDVAGDGRGGWADFGRSSDFRSIPAGKTTRLQGGIPFRILDPARNHGKSCLVMKGAKRPQFPDCVSGIPVNALLNRIYVLHTAMYARKGAPALRYELIYDNGSRHSFMADTRYELPDWWNAQNARNAQVVFRDGHKSLFVSEFINPYPKRKIKSISIYSVGEAIPIVVAITGAKRFASIVAGVGEE